MLGNLSCNVRLGYPTIDVMPFNIQKTHWEQFGAWIRKARRDANLTQKNVADSTGIHEVQLARIEKGESGTKTAGTFTGHSDETMTLYYSHTNRKMLEIAGEVLEQNMGNILIDGEFLEPKA